MELENYFDFVEEDVIRIKGNRIDIEIVLEDYLNGASPEEILLRYPTLNLEKIHNFVLRTRKRRILCTYHLRIKKSLILLQQGRPLRI